MLGLGTFRLTSDQAYDMVRAALVEGYRMIDTAKLYKNEEAVQRAIVDSGVDRSDVFLVTKIQKCNNQLIEERVKIFGQIDCLLLHYPTDSFQRDWEHLVGNKPSQIRHIGVSNFKPHQLDVVTQIVRPYCNQIERSPFWTRNDVFAYHQDQSILTVAHSPLTKTEKFQDERLIRMARQYDTSPSVLMINWSLARGCWTIPRTSKISHLKENQTKIHIQDHDLRIMDTWNECYATHPQYR